MANYVNIIPLLKAKTGKRESFDEDLLLDETLELEEQLPRDLAQAYKDAKWEAGYGSYTAMKDDSIDKRYGTRQLPPDHDLKNLARRSARWDLGKATYERISKQEAVDLLGMVIKEGNKVGRRWENEHEISINDPVPPGDNLHVTFANSGNAGAIENIDKLRFLLPGRNGGYALTEFSYKATYDRQGSKTNNYMPIFRQEFSSSVYDKYNIPHFAKGNRIDWRKNDATYDATMVYYAIKLSDIIYKTDEYDHPIDPVAYSDINYIQNTLRGLLRMSEANKIVSSFIDKVITDESDKEKALELKDEDLSWPQLMDKQKFNADASSKELWDAIEDADVFSLFEDTEGDNFYAYNCNTNQVLEIADAIIRDIDSLLDANSTLINQFNKYYKPEIAKKLDYVDNKDLEKESFYIQDQLLDKIPDSRNKEIQVRRIKNSRKSTYRSYTGGSRIDVTDHTANDVFKDRVKKVKVSDVPDTGAHGKGKNSNVDLPGYYSESNDIERLARAYNAEISDLNAARKYYIINRNLYIKLKNEADYYDAEDPVYTQDLETRKGKFENARESYFNQLTEHKKLKKRIAYFCDKELNETVAYMEKFYSFIEYSHKRLFDLRNTIKGISNYTQQELNSLYGNKGKERLDAINKEITEIILHQQQLADSVNATKAKIAELREQIARLEADVASAEGSIQADEEQVSTLLNERDSLSDNIDAAIEKSYEDQESLISVVTELTSMITKANLSSASSEAKKDNKHVLELANALKQDYINAEEILSSDDPSEDDILQDDEDQGEQPSAA